jgi:hypothetical protein
LQESVITPYLKTVYEQMLVLLPQDFKQQVKERALMFEREWGGKKKAPDQKDET